MTEGFDWRSAHLAWRGFAYYFVPALVLYLLATGVGCAFGRSTRRAAVVRFAFLSLAFLLLLFVKPPVLVTPHEGWTPGSLLYAAALRNGLIVLTVLWVATAIRIPLTRRKQGDQTAEPAGGG